MFFIIIFFFTKILCLNRIKNCNFSSTCLNKNSELNVQIFFNKYPKFVENGELISNSNSSFFYDSNVKISKDKKSVYFKFFPSKIGKYHLKFNKNLQCPEFITVKNSFRIKLMTHSLFILENKNEIQFEINLIFNDSISFSKNLIFEEDVNQIEIVENVDKVKIEENRFEEITNFCNKTNKNEIKCKIKKFIKEKIKNFGVYFHDRCGIRNTLGFISVYSTKNKKNHLKSSFLEYLKSYKMKDYQKNEEIVFFFVISNEKKSHLNYIENVVSEISNKFKLNFVFLNWKNFSFIVDHFNLKDDGNIQLLIFDFGNENTFISKLNENENGKDLEKIINDLINKNLIWTSQNLSEKIFNFFHLNLTKSQTEKIYFNFGIFGFVFLIILRCYLVNKRRLKEPQFKYQNKKIN